MIITHFKRITSLGTLGKIYRGYCTNPAYYHKIGTSPLIYRTLGQEIEQATEKYHDRETFVACYENKRLTYAEALNQADILAAKLLKLGLKSGDHIGLWAPNTIQWYITFLAAARANLVLACINPALETNELKYSLNKAKCKAVIIQDSYKTHNYYNTLKQVIPEIETQDRSREISSQNVPHVKTVIVDTKSDIIGVHKFNDLFINPNEKDLQTIKDLQNLTEPDNSLNIQFTSGTTGRPKAPVLTHFNFVNSSLIFGQRTGLQKSYSHRLLLLAPLFHVFGLTTIISSMQYGATIVIPSPTYNPKESLKIIEKEKCTSILGTPTMLIDSLAEQSRNSVDTSSLRIAVAGGSTCTPQVYRDVKSVFDLDHFHVVYGLSEGTAADFAPFGCEQDSLLEKTSGKVFDHLEAKVINDNGETVNFGEPGELCLRGFAIMKEYFEDEEKTKEILGNDGWMKTGDQFILYETGYGTVVGRKKDIIIRGGENLFPKEIEDFLDTHPDVLESQVIGVPDERLGEEICAFLRMKDNRQDLTLEDIKAYCKGQIAHFKIPKYVSIVKEFPKTASGKIQKFKLREIVKTWKK